MQCSLHMHLFRVAPHCKPLMAAVDIHGVLLIVYCALLLPGNVKCVATQLQTYFLLLCKLFGLHIPVQDPLGLYSVQ